MKLWQAAAGQGGARAQCNLGNVRADGRGAAKNEARAAALSKGIVAMRRIHRAFPQFSNTPYRFDAAPNAVNDWDADRAPRRGAASLGTARHVFAGANA